MKGWRWLLVGLLTVSAAAAAVAEDRPGREEPSPPETEAPTAVDEGLPPEEARRHGGPGWGRDFVTRWFRPAAEDRGPLKPGEDEELLAFVREHMPRLHEALKALRSVNPPLFQRKLGENAPRLRHLRRVFQASPELGQLIRKYAENQFELQRLARRLRLRPGSPAAVEQVLQEARPLIAENVQIEIDALELLRKQLEAHRTLRIAARMQYLGTPGADLSAEPRWVRQLVERWRAPGASESERAAAEAELRAAIARQLEEEITSVAERAAEMRERGAAEVDERVERFQEGKRRNGRGLGRLGPRSPWARPTTAPAGPGGEH